MGRWASRKRRSIIAALMRLTHIASCRRSFVSSSGESLSDTALPPALLAQSVCLGGRRYQFIHVVEYAADCAYADRAGHGDFLFVDYKARGFNVIDKLLRPDFCVAFVAAFKK